MWGNAVNIVVQCLLEGRQQNEKAKEYFLEVMQVVFCNANSFHSWSHRQDWLQCLQLFTNWCTALWCQQRQENKMLENSFSHVRWKPSGRRRDTWFDLQWAGVIHSVHRHFRRCVQMLCPSRRAPCTVIARLHCDHSFDAPYRFLFRVQQNSDKHVLLVHVPILFHFHVRERLHHLAHRRSHSSLTATSHQALCHP